MPGLLRGHHVRAAEESHDVVGAKRELHCGREATRHTTNARRIASQRYWPTTRKNWLPAPIGTLMERSLVEEPTPVHVPLPRSALDCNWYGARPPTQVI